MAVCRARNQEKPRVTVPVRVLLRLLLGPLLSRVAGEHGLVLVVVVVLVLVEVRLGHGGG